MKLSNSLLASVLLAAGLFVSAQNTPVAPVTEVAPTRLQTRFIPGKSYHFSSVTAIRMKLKGRPEMESIVMLEQHVKLKATARALDKPGVVLTGSTDAVKFRMEAGGRQLAFDSTDEKSAASEIGKHFQNSLARWTVIELSNDGKMVSRNDGGGGGAATPLPQLPEIGPDQIQQMIAALITGFPPEPVAPGKEWVHKGETKLGQFGKMDFEIMNHYVGDKLVDNAVCAAIQFKGKIAGDVKLAATDSEKNLGFEGNQMSGRILFDKKLGISRVNEQSVLMQIKNPELPETTIEQKVQIALKSVEENAP